MQSYSYPPELQYFGHEQATRGLSYRQLRKHAWTRYRPRLDRFIYRYRSVGVDEVSIDRLRDTLVRSRIWLARPADFNDPFDSRSYVYFGGTVLQKRERLNRLARDMDPDMNWNDRRKFVDRMMGMSSHELTEIIQKASDFTLDSLGVCCFSRNPRNILSWAHYSGSHRGVCLQFEILRDLHVFGRAVPMEYGNEYPQHDWVASHMEDTTRTVYGKFADWEYEEERRIIAPDGARQWLSFDAAALTAVVIGCAAGEQQKSVIRDLIRERGELGMPPLKVYAAEKHPRQYRLGVVRCKLD